MTTRTQTRALTFRTFAYQIRLHPLSYSRMMQNSTGKRLVRSLNNQKRYKAVRLASTYYAQGAYYALINASSRWNPQICSMVSRDRIMSGNSITILDYAQKSNADPYIVSLIQTWIDGQQRAIKIENMRSLTADVFIAHLEQRIKDAYQADTANYVAYGSMPAYREALKDLRAYLTMIGSDEDATTMHVHGLIRDLNWTYAHG